MPGVGSLEKRGKNSWRLVVSCGRDGDKYIRKVKTIRASSAREAKRMLAEFVTEVEQGINIESSKMTFSEFVDYWLKKYAKGNLALKTIYRYRQYLESRIVPALGQLLLQKIKPTHLLQFYENLQEDGIRTDGKEGGLSFQTILHHHRLIYTILSYAVEWQMSSQNPAERARPPKVQPKRSAVYDQEQAQTLIVALEMEALKYRAIVMLALSTGLRQGELMGLEWQHVNYGNKTIDVQQASQYLPGIGTFTKEPKNESSKRLVSVPPSVMHILNELKQAQEEERTNLGDKWEESGRLFTKWNGSPMYANEMSSWFPRFLRKHALPPLPFHGLRHTSATLLIAEGTSVVDLSRRLGHSKTSTTMDIYVHSLKNADTATADKMEAILKNNKPKDDDN